MHNENISVKNFVDFMFTKGDIDQRMRSTLRAGEGVIIHQYIQKNYPSKAEAEVPVMRYYAHKNTSVTLNGRMDGVFCDEEGIFRIDEIKSTQLEPEKIEEPYYLHEMQVKMYALMFAQNHQLNQIDYSLTYCHAESKKTKIFTFRQCTQRLEEELMPSIIQYIEYIRKIISLRRARNKSIEALVFPFAYRPQQRDIMRGVYTALCEQKNLFLHAPTGSGKTLSTLYPTLKYLLSREAKIFYLVSKGTQKHAAVEALQILQTQGLKIKALVLNAKEKVCLNEVVECNPEQCPYTLGYYDKIRDVLQKMIVKENIIDAEIIQKYAEKHQICPFELSLDASWFCDLVICDYNYVFDPFVALKRYFDDKGEYVLLVDEAHNLNQRGKQMYSASLSRQEIKKCRAQMQSCKPLFSSLSKVMTAYNKLKKAAESDYTNLAFDHEVCVRLRGFIRAADVYNMENGELPGEVRQLYLEIFRLLKLIELADDAHVFYYQKTEECLYLSCLDASSYLASALKKSFSAILFSATFLPISYFMRICGGAQEDYRMICQSPFDPANLRIIVGDVGATFRERNKNIDIIAKYIHRFLRIKKGNYFIFFPSFDYMNNVFEQYRILYPDEEIIMQEPDMNEEEKKTLLQLFEKTDNNIAAFVVLGGSFAESVDLTGEKLIGCVIVSVGLPKVTYEKEKLRTYYEDKGENGFDYAYLYEGISKVIQAAGRLIRTESDKGAILLLDRRFTQGKYQMLIQQNWSDITYISDPDQLDEKLIF
ncbi:MAG: DEAD/DEAH box helicase [Eubacteriaceae bacterium]|nr:DEAD/DEAH box helicase [Eubacteriaceae bacterium]